MELSEIYKIYLQWLALPKKDRKLKSIKEFYTHYKLNASQILDFQDSDSFDEDLKETTIKWAKRQLPELLHTLYSQYQSTKSVADARLFLETASLLRKDAENLTSTTNILNVFEITDERKKEIFNRLTGGNISLDSGSKE